MTLWLHAYASARPRIIQLTTINDKNAPNAVYRSTAYAFKNICKIVTNVAITTMYTGIWISSGVIGAIKLTTTLLNTNTKITPAPIPSALLIEVEIANVEQIPRYNPNTGLSVSILEKKPCFFVFFSLMFLSSLLARC